MRNWLKEEVGLFRGEGNSEHVRVALGIVVTTHLQPGDLPSGIGNGGLLDPN